MTTTISFTKVWSAITVAVSRRHRRVKHQSTVHEATASTVVYADVMISTLGNAVRSFLYTSLASSIYDQVPKLRFRLIALRTVIQPELEAACRHWIDAPQRSRDQAAVEEIRKHDPDSRLDLELYSGWRIEVAPSARVVSWIGDANTSRLPRFEFVGATSDAYESPRTKPIALEAGRRAPSCDEAYEPVLHGRKSSAPIDAPCTQGVEWTSAGCDATGTVPVSAASACSCQGLASGADGCHDKHADHGSTNGPCLTDVKLADGSAPRSGVGARFASDASANKKSSVTEASMVTTSCLVNEIKPSSSAQAMRSDTGESTSTRTAAYNDHADGCHPLASRVSEKEPPPASTEVASDNAVADASIRLVIVAGDSAVSSERTVNLPQTIDLDELSSANHGGCRIHISKLSPAKVLVEVIAGTPCRAGQPMSGAHIIPIANSVPESSDWISLAETSTRLYLLSATSWSTHSSADSALAKSQTESRWHNSHCRTDMSDAVINSRPLMESDAHLVDFVIEEHDSECWQVATATRPGAARREEELCEDAAGARILDDGRLHVAVADGVSGGSRGDLCSAVAVQHALHLGVELGDADQLLSREQVDATMRSATAAVRRALARVGRTNGATVMVSAWLFPDGNGFLAHVGDCRAYRCIPSTRPTVEPLTRDHCYTNLGQEPPPGSLPDAPCRMIGIEDACAHDLQEFHLMKGEILLLLSDGVHGFIPDATLNDFLVANTPSAAESSLDVRKFAERLGRLALEWGSDDDVGIAVVSRRCPNEQRRCVGLRTIHNSDQLEA